MNQAGTNVDRFGSFWPLCLMSASLAVFLGWQVALSVKQYMASTRLATQQDLLEVQAAQTESKLQALVMDLLTLAKTDEDARVIVNKYGIKYNEPQSAPALPTGLVEPQPKSMPGVPDKAEMTK